MPTLPPSIKQLCIGTLISISSLVASAFVSSSLLYGQTVSFAGTQTTLPTNGLSNTSGIAVDSAGDVFVVQNQNSGSVVELPRTATGYGPRITLPFIGLLFPFGIAVDSAGDVFVADQENQRVVELPRSATGYAPQITLPASGLSEPIAVAVDSAGDVFIISNYSQVVELPRTATGYGPQTNLPASLNFAVGVAVDSAGDVFVADNGNGSVVELPRTATGYGPQTNLPASGLGGPTAVAVDSAGDVFIADYSNNRVVEVPRTATGYGPQTNRPTLSHPSGVAVESVGHIFISDFNGGAVELQTRSVDFGSVNICATGQTTPAPCSETLTLNYTVTAGGTLGTPKVLTGGAPNLDFKAASGSTCTGAVSAGATCIVNVTFAPLAKGVRNGSVRITDGSGNVLTATPISGFGQAVTIDFSQGFAQSQGTLQLNGDASLSGNSLELTDGNRNEAGSAFYTTPVNVQKFTTDFDFQLTNARADGFTFTIQNAGLGALGSLGGGLGYKHITRSVAIKFDLYSNAGEGINSTGLYLDGTPPKLPAIDLTGTGIDLHSGHKMHAGIIYDGTTLTLTLTDMVTMATWTNPFTVDIPATVGSDAAYVGFTGGSGGLTAIQQILDWQFTSTE